MDPALLKLMRLQLRGMFRRIGRGARTLRGGILFVLGILIIGFWVGSAAFSASLSRSSPDHVRAVGPVLLLGICLLTTVTSAGDKAVAFTPGEVDFLFPGPFTRRQLLFYKLTKSTAAAALSAVILAFALLRHSSLWFACYVGIFLTMLFVQFLSTALVMVGQTMGQRRYARFQRLVLIVVAVMLILGVQSVMARHPLGGPNRLDVPGLIHAFAVSQIGSILLAPFSVFVQTLTAERIWPDLLKWGGQAAFIDALLLGVLVKLDANYLEAAAAASQRRYERLRRLRTGGALALGAGRTSVRRIPRPPFLSGAGPIAWRQLTQAFRSARSLLILLGVLALVVGPVAVAGRSDSRATSMTPLLLTMAWLSVMLASLLRFDFRADLDAMDVLKALPLPSWAIALGQLVAPTLVLTCVHLLLIGAVAYSLGGSHSGRATLVVAAVLALPFNALLFSAENLIFLIAPSRPAAVGPGDFQLVGRQLLTLMLRGIMVAVGGGIATGLAAVAYILSSRSIVVLMIVAATTLALEVAALVPAMAWAFRRFDPSTHTPA